MLKSMWEDKQYVQLPSEPKIKLSVARSRPLWPRTDQEDKGVHQSLFQILRLGRGTNDTSALMLIWMGILNTLINNAVLEIEPFIIWIPNRKS